MLPSKISNPTSPIVRVSDTTGVRFAAIAAEVWALPDMSAVEAVLPLPAEPLPAETSELAAMAAVSKPILIDT
ncbi:hypothetical protein GCM10023307_06340 [Lysobacter hankyongensis]|uniref:Uncharacterized protein n=1 Tax=Lysobacter hankyongensis TaxID=1176535 RepID=A0ABP9AQ84_9GAMM